jgi:hypothetical protein
MRRAIEKDLLVWKNAEVHKPLILMGARQVGKSYVIERNFSPHFARSLPINFERHMEFYTVFQETQKIFLNRSAHD